MDRLGLGDLTNGKVGHILTVQLIQYQYSGPGNPREIAREIHHLDKGDGFSRTKKETIFSSGKLKGFHHKHFLSARHIQYNMMQHHIDGNTNEFGKSFERVHDRIIGSDCSNDEKATKLADFLTMDAYKQRSRSKKLTGDWIIYKKHGGINYYLCISSHQENTDELYERLKSWYNPLWSFLFK